MMNGLGCAYYTIDGFLNYGTSLGRFANEPDYPNTANVTASWIQTNTTCTLGSTESGYIAFVATRDILADAEIYYKYGSGYVRNW
jgi:SET domain-containing protein